MARSQEKAMSTLNRWVDQKRVIEGGSLSLGAQSRLPSECKSVKEAEAARSQTVRQLTTLIAQIQNAALGEQRIRDMNDQINRCVRSKYVWEAQIRRLGGPDYTSLGSRIGESEGVQVPGQSGYRYFGAARDLPGVRELLEQEPAFDTNRRTRKQLLSHIHTDYYGWMDDQDPLLMLAESEMETTSISQLNELRKTKREALTSAGLLGEKESQPYVCDFILTSTGTLDTHEIEKLLIERKKQMLMARYIVCLSNAFSYIFLGDCKLWGCD